MKRIPSLQKLKYFWGLLDGLSPRLEAMSAELQATQARLAPAEIEIERLRGDSEELFGQLVQAAARNMAHAGDHRLIPAHEPAQSTRGAPALRIGLFDNLANQAFITARAWRKLGLDVDLVLQRGAIDQHFLHWPEWEECEVEGDDRNALAAAARGWQSPSFVRDVAYDYELQARYAGRPEAAAEVARLYSDAFGKELPRDHALVLAQYMGSWPYIQAMNDYDVVVLSMSAIMFGAFSPKPTVICPLGGDLYLRAFEQNVVGLMFRAGFRQAAHLSVCETDYFAYLDRLGARASRDFMPLIVDTDVYRPGEEPETRAGWTAQVGGERFLLGVCRQDWTWKGSDKLIRGFARFRDTPSGKRWRLLLQAWGADLERSRALVSELGLDAVTLWLPMCSKPLLRKRQRAADAVADQLVMEGYGASVLESLAAAKPVIIRPVPEDSKHHFRNGSPPFISATSSEDVSAAMEYLSEPGICDRIGRSSRVWVEGEHGYRTLGPRYASMLNSAARPGLRGHA